MNVIDFISSATQATDNTISNKIAVRTQSKKFETRAQQYVNDILDFYLREIEFINNNLSYGTESRNILRQEDKELLIKKLTDVAKDLPNKLKEALDDVFGATSDTEKAPEEEKKASTETENTATVSVVTNQTDGNTSASVETSHFGY